MFLGYHPESVIVGAGVSAEFTVRIGKDKRNLQTTFKLPAGGFISDFNVIDKERSDMNSPAMVSFRFVNEL